MPRPASRYDRDTGGPAGLLAAKAALRQEVWSQLRAAKVARFPGAAGRIPNFTGAEAAAERLRGMAEWQAAGTLKANPDAAQWPVRQRALEDGKTVYMAVPRLAGRSRSSPLPGSRSDGLPRCQPAGDPHASPAEAGLLPHPQPAPLRLQRLDGTDRDRRSSPAA